MACAACKSHKPCAGGVQGGCSGASPAILRAFAFQPAKPRAVARPRPSGSLAAQDLDEPTAGGTMYGAPPDADDRFWHPWRYPPTWRAAGDLPSGVTQAQWDTWSDQQRKAYVEGQLANPATSQQDRIALIGRLVAEGITGATTLVTTFLDRETARLRTEADRDLERARLQQAIELAKIQAERDIRLAEAGFNPNPGTTPTPTPAPAPAPPPPASTGSALESAPVVLGGLTLLGFFATYLLKR